MQFILCKVITVVYGNRNWISTTKSVLFNASCPVSTTSPVFCDETRYVIFTGGTV